MKTELQLNKSRHILELLMYETMKLPQHTEKKITKNKSSKNVLHLEITEIILFHYNIVNNSYQQS